MQLFASSEIAILVSDADLEMCGELRAQQLRIAMSLPGVRHWFLNLQPVGNRGAIGQQLGLQSNSIGGRKDFLLKQISPNSLTLGGQLSHLTR